MAHRTCGLIYHAHQLEGIDEKTEVMLVRHIEEDSARHIEEDSATKEWIGAIPTAADDEPKDVTTLEWIGAQREVITAKVRYVRMDAKGMPLHDQLPASWKVGEYRAFEVRDIPLTALKNNDPTLRRPFPPPVITDLLRPQGKTSPEEPGPDLTRQLVETVSGLADGCDILVSPSCRPATIDSGDLPTGAETDAETADAMTRRFDRDERQNHEEISELQCRVTTFFAAGTNRRALPQLYAYESSYALHRAAECTFLAHLYSSTLAPPWS